MHDMLCGKLLGDGCLTKQLHRKPRFQFTHSKKDTGWSLFCFEQLSPFISLNPPKYIKIIDARTIAGFTESYIVQSRTSDELCELYETWYPHSKKALPFSYIENHFTDKTLAWWYQDDGHLKIQNGIPRKIILSTDSFSLAENHFLIEFLNKRYGLHFSIDAQNRLLLYDQYQIMYFLKLVDPYIHESMNRKRRLSSDVKKIANRTTIYLPSDIQINKPTLEINEQYKKLTLLLSLSDNHIHFFQQTKTLLNSKAITKPYQIQIENRFKENLMRLRNQSGLNISQLTTLCFKLNM
ncbi:LAGLIDADG family DNA endonuclease [Planococcus donghaensis MPA1U2]|uniref:LAGLIDADG family DNA endonuclease n=1 Tax=Planococcus donghaensis MPA1U2 TaxID=933115 RepID=E7RIY7_9BACL|nr:LAGLIDADG family DNA endonuclease [Planococcus donghaensis]EGA88997.1 LAGLIDADG family DNA endonuclease [Planococcus donghaensis MPA1U2]